MIVAAVNPNVVEIPVVQTGCLKSEFDSTYPTHLNGIIGQDEFQESIGNINRAISSGKSFTIFVLLAITCFLGGLILLVFRGDTTGYSWTFQYPVFAGLGLGLFGFGILLCVCTCIYEQSCFTVRIQQAIANESQKYSMRTPTPCTWRFHSSRYRTGGCNNSTVTVERIIIKIGHSRVPGSENMSYQYNQVSSQPTSFFSQPNNIAPPPPYDSHMGGGFCPHCGAPRQNAMAKFCSSCGQPLNM